MTKLLSFRSIHVDRMYDRRFSGLQLANLSPRVNLIFGTNASGKTTLAHAIQSALLPSYSDGGAAKLEARLQRGDDVMEVTVDGKRRVWKVNGKPTSWEPDLVRPRSYHVSLHDLLKSDGADQDFAQEIIKEASGGFDTRAAAKKLQYAAKPPRPRKLSKNATLRMQELQSIKDAQRGLLLRQAQLQGLRARLKEAEAARNRSKLIGAVLEYQATNRAWEVAQEALGLFPSVLGRPAAQNLDNTQAQIDQESKKISGCENEIASIELEIGRIKTELGKSRIPGAGLPGGFLAHFSGLIRELKNGQDRLDQIEAQRNGYQEAAEKLWESLSDDARERASSLIAVEDVRTLGKAFQRLQKVEADRNALTALQRILQVESDDGLSDKRVQLQVAQASLVGWLGAQKADQMELRTIAVPLLMSLVGALALTVVVFDPGSLLPSILGTVATIAIGWALLRLRGAAKDTNEQDHHKRQFMNQDVPEPDSWTAEDVTATLKRIHSMLGRVEVDQQKAEQWAARASEKEAVDHTWSEAAAALDVICEKIGVDLERDPSLYALISQILQYQEAELQIRKADGELATLRNQLEAQLDQINQGFVRCGHETAQTLTEAEEQLEALRVAQHEMQLLQKELKNLETNREKAQSDLATAKQHRDKFYKDLDLEPGDQSSLHQLVSQHGDYVQQRKQVDERRAIANQLRSKLESTVGFSEEMTAKSAEALGLERERLDALAEQHRDTLEEIARIKQQIKDAEGGSSLEQALTAFQVSLDQLSDRRDEICEQTVGYHLAEALVKHTSDKGLPAVFNRAKQNFLMVTNGRYELGLDDDNFSAKDMHEDGARKAPDQLSSGTQVQLLLCVRVAFVESDEGEYRFPLTLDEALANSDDERAEMIIKAITKLGENRQVFYFTAQKDEVNKWKDLAGDDAINLVELHEHWETPASQTATLF